ncbi:hypothetical protein KM043_012573 [Ampulex compressa]|nr:hypothetical protein KM043_012573 [Ampulex compressa]
MKVLIFVAFAMICLRTISGGDRAKKTKVVCYWNSTAADRTGPGQFKIADIEDALSLCTELVYGYAGINPKTFELISLNPKLDTGAGYAYYRRVNHFKRTFPHLKVFLGIGGNADTADDTHKYLKLTETPESRTKFINSVQRFLLDYDFDGVDLAWQFPPASEKKDYSRWGLIVHKVKKVFGAEAFEDDKKLEHRDGFTILVLELKVQLELMGKALTITVLPHVSPSVYYDARALAPNVDAVHLFAFDQKTPENSPKEADYPAPIYARDNHAPEDNIEAAVGYWLDKGTPASKIVIGVPTFGRTWKLTSESQISGIPPLVADGPGAEGPLTGTPGLLSYAEVCSRLSESAVGRLTKVSDQAKNGSYAFQPYNSDTGADGIWVGFEDPFTASNKVAYATDKGLGGVAVVDLTLDDFKGICTGMTYPVLRGVRHRIQLIVALNFGASFRSRKHGGSVWSSSSHQSVHHPYA